MNRNKFALSLIAVMLLPVPALATKITGNVALPEQMLNPGPDRKSFGGVQRVLNLTYDTNNRPLVYLTGLNNTEDTKPFKFSPMHFDRLGAKDNNGWVLKGGTIELINDDNIALDLVIVDGNGQKQVVQLQEKHSFDFTPAQSGSYEIFLPNHYSERAFLFVGTTHYVKQAGSDYNFVIEDLPPGTATVNVWFNGEVISATTREIPDDGDVSVCFFVNNDGALVGDSCENAKKFKRR